ncbi:UNVERIFIED_CONTAM: superfamily I DNA and RNA helicase [Acetivibrio alkalicellulosi]
MKKNILSQEFYNDPISQKLVELLESFEGKLDNATIFYQYPLIRELDQELKYPSVLLVSPYHGIVLFKCDSISKVRNEKELITLDEEASHLEDIIFSRLIKSPNKKLKKGKRNLSFNLSSAIYIPNFVHEFDKEDFNSDILINNIDIFSYLDKIIGDSLDNEVLSEIYSILEGSTAIVRAKDRKIKDNDTSSKAYILKKLEEEIAVFDEQQKYAALSQLEGPQRIRGLAGSGKTIILCMKAAILHLKYPEKKILYTFMTRSLYDYVEFLITRFYKALGDGRMPDFEESINIRHAWGGQNVRGVYYDCCKIDLVSPINFSEAVSFGGREDAFDYICKDLLERTSGNLTKTYDYVLIDEAQDFKASFYQICRSIVKNDCIVWGYDELQNIFNVKIQDTKQTFSNKYGAKGIDLAELQEKHPDMDNDIVLSKCYRNPREVLVIAHAIGFGIYNDKLIQALENKEHWNDLGYNVISGECKNGELMKIKRPEKNSPLSVSKYQSADEIIEIYSAENMGEEVIWVCNSIEKAVKEEGLKPDDISVISLDDRYAKSYFNTISDCLHSKGIYSHNLSANSYEKGFLEDECVTLTTVYKAKGNEAAMIFVIGCDVLESKKNSRAMRNKVFTAFTRAKAWLKISGVGIDEHSLVKEINTVKENNFKLIFTHKESHVIQRDLADVNAKKSRLRNIYKEMYLKAKKEGYSDEEIENIMKEMEFAANGSDKK